MSIRWRVALVGSVIFASFAAIVFAVVQLVVLPSFGALEHQQALDDVDRCVRALDREVLGLHRVCTDWARWDDTYAYVKDRDSAYETSNLVSNSFNNNGLNIIAVTGADGQLVWGGLVEEGSETIAPLDAGLRRTLLASSPVVRLIRPTSLDDDVEGLLLTGRGPLLLASEPITNSFGDRPPRGALIMGRFLTPALLERMRVQTRVHFEAGPVAPEAAARLRQPPATRATGPNWLEATAAYPDLTGASGLVVTASLRRSTMEHGRAAARIAMLSTVGGGLLVLALVFWTLRRDVVRPLVRLSEHVTRLRRTGALAERFEVVRDDEIGRLAREFDDLMRELHLARKDLTNQAGQLAATVQAMPAGLVVVDPALSVVTANARFQDMWGLTAAVDGRPFVDCLPHSVLHEQGLLDKLLDIAMSGGKARVDTLAYPIANGTGVVNVTLRAFRVATEWNPEDYHVLLVFEDVTRAHRLEDQLRQSAKMEAIGTLAGGVAHDFNNILTGIRGYVDFALAEAEGQDSLREELLQVRGLADRAAALTRQLLAFSRRQPLQFTVVEVNALVEGLTRMLRRLIGEDIELVFEGMPGLPPINADPGQIEQALINLAINARDAMPTGGRLTIRTSLPASGNGDTIPPAGSEVVLSVIDTGVGMDEETRKRAFEPFFTTKEVGKGTGLGLATVHGIIGQHNGRVEVDSEAGRGTEFRLYLPALRAAPAEPRSTVETSPTRGRGESVLVVEDEASVREVVTRVLTRHGYRVHSAEDGAEAEAFLAQHDGNIDLLLTDVVMPGCSGPELYSRLSSREPSLAVLYMSGYADAARTDHTGLPPGELPLLKPFTPGQLLRRLQAVLTSHQAPSSLWPQSVLYSDVAGTVG